MTHITEFGNVSAMMTNATLRRRRSSVPKRPARAAMTGCSPVASRRMRGHNCRGPDAIMKKYMWDPTARSSTSHCILMGLYLLTAPPSGQPTLTRVGQAGLSLPVTPRANFAAQSTDISRGGNQTIRLQATRKCTRCDGRPNSSLARSSCTRTTERRQKAWVKGVRPLRDQGPSTPPTGGPFGQQ